MIKIGIELNGIVRNVNYQLMKYYKKDVNPTFDETKISSNITSIIEKLPFDSKSARNDFAFVDYPYEIYGCARVMENNLSTKINEWLINLEDNEDDKFDVSFFSLRENDLSIPSTYYFISKIATRVRKMFFPRQEDNLWEIYDIIITTNKYLIRNKPLDKISVLIEKDDNIKSKKEADYSYKKLSEALSENQFINKENIKKITNKDTKTFYNKIKNWFKK